MKAKLDAEQAAKMAELKAKEEEAARLHAEAEAGNAAAAAKEAEMKAKIEAEKLANENEAAER